MATTRHKLYEQIHRILTGGDQAVASPFERLEIIEAIGQVINSLLKAESYAGMTDGDIPPSGLILAHYGGIAVAQYKTNYALATLPAVPVRLPKNMGVFSIGPTDDPFCSYIPVPAGLYQMISEEPLISDVLGQVAYEIRGNKVVFTTNIVAASPSVTAVDMVLVVMDISTLSDTEPLPIPAEMEVQVITGVLQLLGIKPPTNDKVDPVTENKIPVQQ
jgi:hypothetical protein